MRLLGHERRAGRVGVAALDEARLRQRTSNQPHRPFEWGWRAVGVCSPCLRWWGRLCRRRCPAEGCARAVLMWGGVSRGYTIIIERRWNQRKRVRLPFLGHCRSDYFIEHNENSKNVKSR